METIMKHTVLRLIGVAAVLVLLICGAEGRAQEFTLPVEHNHLFGSCKGDLIIGADAVEYRTDHKKHSRRWNHTDIKMIKLDSPTKLEVLSYESRLMKLGGDRTFEFKVVKGEVPKAASDFLLSRVSRPLATSFVKSEEKGQFEILARHRHRLGDCEGTIKVLADRIVYESARLENSRLWRWSDVQGISRTGPFQFSITSYEPKLGGPTKTYNFDLKERMSDTAYDYLWTRIYKITLPASLDVRQ
jgi:hypothetical protein